MNIEYEKNGESLIFKINKSIYLLPVIMKASYIFTNSFYIFFDYIDEGYIEVHFKSKGQIAKSQLENKVGEFCNELLCQCLRFDIQNKTKDLRMLILGRALHAECIEIKEDKEICNNAPESGRFLDTKEDYNRDPYRIGFNWHENMRCVKNDTDKSDKP